MPRRSTVSFEVRIERIVLEAARELFPFAGRRARRGGVGGAELLALRAAILRGGRQRDECGEHGGEQAPRSARQNIDRHAGASDAGLVAV